MGWNTLYIHRIIKNVAERIKPTTSKWVNQTLLHHPLNLKLLYKGIVHLTTPLWHCWTRQSLLKINSGMVNISSKKICFYSETLIVLKWDAAEKPRLDSTEVCRTTEAVCLTFILLRLQIRSRVFLKLKQRTCGEYCQNRLIQNLVMLGGFQVFILWAYHWNLIMH